MLTLKQYRIPVITAVAAVVVALIVYLAWISPEGTKLSTLKKQQTHLQLQELSLQGEIAALKREKANLAPTCTVLTKDVTEIPAAPDVDSFLQQVTALAVSSGDPNTPSISVTQAGLAKGVTPVAVAFTLSGTYGQMMQFLQGLYSFPRLFTISEISVGGGPVASGGSSPSPSTPNYTVSLDGDIYYSAGQQNACTPAL